MPNNQKILFRRTIKNFSKVMTGKAVGALMALAYLALAARGLGPDGLGIIILIHSYMIMFTRIISFKSYDIIVKYGADSISSNNFSDFQELVKFTFLLDFFGAIVGIIIGTSIVRFWGSHFGIPENSTTIAAIYCILIFSNITDTTTGILRISDRFDLVAILATVEPIVRLIGVSIAFYQDASWQVYLLAWFVARIFYCAISLIITIRELLKKNYLCSFTFSTPNLSHRWPKIWRFSWSSNFYGTVNSIGIQLTTLVVGSSIGTSGAALFKIAQEVAEASAKAAQTFGTALYPELARLVSSKIGVKEIKSVVNKTVKSSLTFGVLFTTVLIFSGHFLLGGIFGAEFVGAHEVMVVLSIGTTILLATFPYEAAVYSIGKPHIAFFIKLTATIVQLSALVLMLGAFGLLGAGYAIVLSSSLSAILLASITRINLNDN